MELKRLIQQTEAVTHVTIHLKAGALGLENNVRWMHIIEKYNTVEFINAGELVLTTGIGNLDETELLQIIEAACRRHASGILINTGPYIPETPDAVTAFCDAHGFPLYTIAWKVQLAEIMHQFSIFLTEEDRKYIETVNAFRNAIFLYEQKDLYEIYLNRCGFDPEWNYTAAVIRIHTDASSVDLTLAAEKASTDLHNSLSHHFHHTMVFSDTDRIIAVAGNCSTNTLNCFLQELQRYLKIYLPEQVSWTMGVGKTTKSIRCLYKSYRQAASVQKLQEKPEISRGKIFYSEMGIYKLLMNIEDPEIIEDYLEYTIRPLQDYDSLHEDALVETLRCYLNNDGSVKKTADQLFVHRNTVNYRLRKMESLLGTSLSSNEGRMQLTVALMLQDIL